MRKKIVSFGDSFIFGTEIKNNNNGHAAWPGLIASDIGVEYETYAIPGCGNEAITRQILAYFSNNPSNNVLAVINWTWGLRWDFYIPTSENWVTLGLTCVPSKLIDYVTEYEAERIINFYRDYPGHSIIWDKFRTFQTMYTAQQLLKSLGVVAIQTYTDAELWDQTWHSPDYIKIMQESVQGPMLDFEGRTFLDWSRHNGFKITEAWHPLDDAHRAAADLWRDRYVKAINTL